MKRKFIPSRPRRVALKLDPRNARLHGERNKSVIRQSLEEIGAFRSIAVDGDNVIRAGNGVFEQAQQLGLRVRVIEAQPDELIAVKRKDLRGKLAERAAILDNRAGELAEWNSEILADIAKSDRDLLDGLWNDDELGELLQNAQEIVLEESVDPDELVDRAAEFQKKWRVQQGDLFEIPSKTTPKKCHRLQCGDSTNASDVTRLMNGQKAALMSTDPPYLINYTGAGRPKKNGSSGGKDWSDKYREVKGEERETFLSRCFSQWLPHLRDNAAWFVWHAHQTQTLFERELTKLGLLIVQQMIWVKPTSTMTYSIYGWQHEPCFFGWKKGHKPFVAKGWFKDQSHTTVWVIDFDGKRRMVGNAHPTQKPLEIFARPIRGHTLPGDICAEPFSGSGSQLVAGEMCGRIVYANEVTPEFVAVALERLSLLGLEPRRVSGRTPSEITR